MIAEQVLRTWSNQSLQPGMGWIAIRNLRMVCHFRGWIRGVTSLAFTLDIPQPQEFLSSKPGKLDTTVFGASDDELSEPEELVSQKRGIPPAIAAEERIAVNETVGCLYLIHKHSDIFAIRQVSVSRG
jgi:hypothetical protein